MALLHHMDADAAAEEEEEEATTLMRANLLMDEIKRITGYEFRKTDLLLQAFTDYKRLEYVGDAVLGFFVARKHYSMYPDLKSGQLTQLRSANVDTEKLARAAVTHRLHRFLRHTNHVLDGQIKQFEEEIVNYPVQSFRLIQVPKALANFVEFLIGAVVIDSNSTDITFQVAEKLLQPMITLATLDTNPVTKLYELCQKYQLHVELKDLWIDTGVIEFYVGGELMGRGTYKGKREVALKRAASDAYERLLTKLNLLDSSPSSPSSPIMAQETTPRTLSSILQAVDAASLPLSEEGQSLHPNEVEHSESASVAIDSFMADPEDQVDANTSAPFIPLGADDETLPLEATVSLSHVTVLSHEALPVEVASVIEVSISSGREDFSVQPSENQSAMVSPIVAAGPSTDEGIASTADTAVVGPVMAESSHGKERVIAIEPSSDQEDRSSIFIEEEDFGFLKELSARPIDLATHDDVEKAMDLPLFLADAPDQKMTQAQQLQELLGDLGSFRLEMGMLTNYEAGASSAGASGRNIISEDTLGCAGQERSHSVRRRLLDSSSSPPSSPIMALETTPPTLSSILEAVDATSLPLSEEGQSFHPIEVEHSESASVAVDSFMADPEDQVDANTSAPYIPLGADDERREKVTVLLAAQAKNNQELGAAQIALREAQDLVERLQGEQMRIAQELYATHESA